MLTAPLRTASAVPQPPLQSLPPVAPPALSFEEFEASSSPPRPGRAIQEKNTHKSAKAHLWCANATAVHFFKAHIDLFCISPPYAYFPSLNATLSPHILSG